MPPVAISPDLILRVLELGLDVATAIFDAVRDGDVDAVKRLHGVMHSADQLALEDAALVASQRAKAGL
jgi:hypothetical protein